MGSELKEYLKHRLLEAGASAVGFAVAEPVDTTAWRRREEWLAMDYDGQLGYMRNHAELRRNPSGLLPGIQTVVSVAWNYLPSELRDPSLPFVARYAYGRDYHKSLRSILRPICRDLETRFGCRSRICIDSAPVAERYWARKSGIGFIGKNGCLIVPGTGSWVFLSEILLTVAIPADEPLEMTCLGCNACIKTCPGNAIGTTGTVDTRKCLSCATVEGTDYEGNLPQRPHLLGCDRCQEVCSHNQGSQPSEWLVPIKDILELDGAILHSMEEDSFRTRFAGTSFLRPGREGLLRNLRLVNQGQ